MRLHVATTNSGKLAEFVAQLGPLGFDVVGPPPGFDVVEDGVTFADNAVKKARALAARVGTLTVADDSGLAIDALGGAPGVHSARYSGTAPGPGCDAANRRAVLAALADVPADARAARLICVLALWRPAAEPVTFAGAVSGRIAMAAAGSGGFGYDSIFVPVGHAASFAQLPAATKAAIGHRGQALRALVAYLGAPGLCC